MQFSFKSTTGCLKKYVSLEQYIHEDLNWQSKVNGEQDSDKKNEQQFNISLLTNA